jgi:hypothetical protein
MRQTHRVRVCAWRVCVAWCVLRPAALPGARECHAPAHHTQHGTHRPGDTPLLYIAREGHYKFPPAEIPALLVQSGASLEATDAQGRTALQVRR